MLNKLNGLVVFLCLLVVSGVAFAVSPEELHKIQQAAPSQASVTPKQERKLLVFNLSQGYGHSSIPYVAKALEVIGEKSGAYSVEHATDMSAFEPENLKRFDAVCFNNTTVLTFDNIKYRQSLMRFVKGGKGIVGIHAATDNFYNWPEAAEMMGGTFMGHPWNAGGTWAVKLNEPDHPLNAAFKGQGFKISDEIYLVRQLNLRANAKILLSLDFSDPATCEPETSSRDVPISWIRSFEKGRVFYCSLGHNHDVLWNSAVLKHYLDGIQFALGDLSVDMSPTGPDMDRLNRQLEKLKTYDYSKSNEAIVDLKDFLVPYYDKPDDLRKIEAALLAFLGSDATFPAKQFICSQLAVFGTEASVDMLGVMLLSDETVDMACFALESIGGPKSHKALYEALKKTSGKSQIGIINSLGQLKSSLATKDLAKFIYSKDILLANASLNALGKIADKKAAKSLGKAIKKLKGSPLLITQAYISYLECAERLANEGDFKYAKTLYEDLYHSDKAPLTVRSTALRGLIRVDASNAFSIIKKAIDQPVPEFQTTAITMLGQVQDKKTLAEVSSFMSDISADQQIQLLTALAEGGNPESVSAVLQAMTSDDQNVRIAAVQSLKTLGNTQHLSLIAQTAANTKGKERNAARNLLYSMNRPDFDEAIVQMIPGADRGVKIELIKAVGERRIQSGLDMLLGCASDPDRKVRLEAFKVMREIPDVSKLKTLLALLLEAPGEPERRAAEKTMVIFAKQKEKNQQSSDVLKALKTPKTDTVEVSLMRVLGGIADQQAYQYLKKKLGHENAQIRITAIKELAQWPNSNPVKDLYQVASNTAIQNEKILALRGYIQTVKLDTKSTPKQKIELYKKAMDLASDINEKRMVLSGLGATGSVEAMEMAAGFLEEDQLKNEAELAIMQNAKVAYPYHYRQVRGHVEHIMQTSENEAVLSQARDLMTVFKPMQDYIGTWKVSGFYMKDNLSSHGLMDVEFLPETTDYRNAEWKPIAAFTDPDKPWEYDFNELYKGNKRAVYMFTKVWSPKQQEALLELGSDDGIKAWLNGQVVHRMDKNRPIVPGEDKVQITLNEGWNTVLLKIVQASGGWGVVARIGATDGSQLSGLKFDTNMN